MGNALTNNRLQTSSVLFCSKKLRSKKKRRRKPKDFVGVAREPIPTIAYPRSKEKIEVMAKRALRGESLFHIDDAKLPDDMGFVPDVYRNGSLTEPHVVGIAALPGIAAAAACG